MDYDEHLNRCDIHDDLPAEEWCSYCDQALCIDCVEFHRLSNSTKYHETTSSIHSLPSYVRHLSGLCKKHKQTINFFCVSHNIPCCIKCVYSAHKICRQIDSIDNVIEQEDSISVLYTFGRKLARIENYIEDAIQYCEQNVKYLKNQKRRKLKRITQMKKAIKNHLDTLENATKEELNVKTNVEVSKITEISHVLEEKRNITEQFLLDIAAIEKNASPLQTFLATRELSSKIKSHISELCSFEQNNHLFQIKVYFEQEQFIYTSTQQINSLGHIVVKSNPVQMELVPKDILVDTQDASEDSYSSVDMVDESEYFQHVHNEEREHNTVPSVRLISLPDSGNEMQITSCKILNSCEYILSDWTNKRLIIVRNNGQLRKEIVLSSRPFDIVCISKNIVGVSLKREISMINIKSLKSKTVDLYQGCHGITFGNSALFVCLASGKKIQMIEYPSCKKTSSIPTPFDTFNIEFLDRLKTLCCTNFKENIIFLVGLRGEVLWECPLAGTVEPFCLKSDLEGNFYVACRQRNNVLVISPDGKVKREIINKESQPRRPRGLDFCPKTNQLIVSEERSGSIRSLLFR